MLNGAAVTVLSVGAIILALMSCARASAEVKWRHPVGEYDLGRLGELAAEAKARPWAEAYIRDLQQRARPWLDHSDEDFLAVVPRRRGQVKELFICPECRKRLPFDPFKPDDVVCPVCKQAVDTSQTCPETDRWGYHGTIWHGWAELWHYEFASGVACEQRSYIEFVFGAGDYSPDRLPEHRSLHYVIKHHLRPDDGTFWENTTGYDFAAYVYMAQMLVAGHMLSRMDRNAFPPAQFDFAHPTSPFHRPMRRALYGYLGYCLPDGTQIVVGDYGQRYSLFTGKWGNRVVRRRHYPCLVTLGGDEAHGLLLQPAGVSEHQCRPSHPESALSGSRAGVADSKW